ncbi:MAG: DUF2207 domain-containing protein [bacterium]|nr:DUF2207 domain-containing protein [bacterium]
MDKKGAPTKRGLIIEIDRAAVRSFSLLAILIGSGWLIFTAARPQADISQTLTSTFTNTATTQGETQSSQIEVKPNGEVYIDNVLTKETVQRTTEADEIRLKLIDGESDFIPRLDVTLHLPQPLRAETGKPTYDILAVHGANRQRPSLIDQQTIRFVVTEIEPEATVTIFAQMPRRSLTLGIRAAINSLATATDAFWWWISGALLPLLTLGYLIFKHRVRLQAVNQTGGVVGPPSNLAPAAVGLLINERIGHEQLAATLVAMACRGDIQIVQTRSGYRVARKRVLTDLSEAEQFLISELRIQIGPIGRQEIIESELKKKLFSQKITSAYISIFSELEQRGFFATDAAKRKASVRWHGLLAIIISIVGAVAISITVPSGSLTIPAWAGLFIAGWTILVKASQIPLLTSVGAQERAHWLSFRNWLSLPKPMSGGQENAKLFFLWLPYAIALGVLTEWISRFNTDFIHIPEWYFNEDNPGSTEVFVRDISDITDEISRTLTASAIPQT